VAFALPERENVQWRLLLDTASRAEPGDGPAAGDVTSYTVGARSIAVFNGTAP
jgi:hypothetical protein